MFNPVEVRMLKPLIAATAIFAIAGSSIVYAQEGFGRHRGSGDGANTEQHHRPSGADIAAFTDARIAALRAGLELTPDQAKNWPAFEQALRDMAQLRVQRVQARQSGDQQNQSQSPNTTPATPFDRMARRADNMAKTGAALKHVADAGGPLYQSLDDAQKGRFAKLARFLRPHHRGQAGNRGNEGGGWRQGRGYGRDGHRFGHEWRRFGQNDRGHDGSGPAPTEGESSQDSQL
jgi:hypothetical protein